MTSSHAAAPPASDPRHPVLTDQTTLDRARRRIETASFQTAWRRLRSATEAFLELDLEPPDEPAGYYHDYFCPEHATGLRFDPCRPRTHRCPVDGRLLVGCRFDAAWRFGANLLLSRMAVLLAVRWRLAGDRCCLQRAAAILSGYARRYRHYPVGDCRTDRGDGRGKATWQSLDEANLVTRLAYSYDLVAADLDADSRRAVEHELLVPAIAHLDAERFRRVHNIECWHIAALVAAATVTGNDAIRQDALHGEFGFHHQIKAGTYRDGMWWEGSSSYHYYTVAALLTTAAFVRARDSCWQPPERLAAMMAAPLTLVLPDGSLPATNDCWASPSLFGEVCHGVPPAAALYEMAAGWWPQPAYRELLAAIYRRCPRDSEEALLYGPDSVPADSGNLSGPRSGLLPHSGFAVLRSDDPLERQSLVLLKYGPHGGSHGHPDKLTIVCYARGVPAATDLGSQGYGIALHGQWYRQTVSHNTVLVGGLQQPPATGRLRYFVARASRATGKPRARSAVGELPGAGGPTARTARETRATLEAACRSTGVTLVDATVSWSGASAGVYDGVRMRRVIAWRAPYFVDFFHVHCPTRRRIDWLLHVRGALQEVRGAALSERDTGSLPRAPGWRHIAVRRDARVVDGAVSVVWSLRQGALQVVLPDDAGTTISTGEAPSNPASERLHTLLRTRHSQATTFTAVIHPCDDPGMLTAVLHHNPDHTGTLKVTADKRKDRWRLGPLARADSGHGPALIPVP